MNFNYSGFKPVYTKRTGRTFTPASTYFNRLVFECLLTNQVGVPIEVNAGRVGFSVQEYIRRASHQIGGDTHAFASVINAVLAVLASRKVREFNPEDLTAQLEERFDFSTFWGYDPANPEQRVLFSAGRMTEIVREALEFSINRNVLTSAISNGMFDNHNYMQVLARMGEPLSLESVYRDMIDVLQAANTMMLLMNDKKPFTDVITIINSLRASNQFYQFVESLILSSKSMQVSSAKLPMFEVVNTLLEARDRTDMASLDMTRIPDTNMFEVNPTYDTITCDIVAVFNLALIMLSDITNLDVSSDYGIENYGAEATRPQPLSVAEIVDLIKRDIADQRFMSTVNARFDTVLARIMTTDMTAYLRRERREDAGSRRFDIIGDFAMTNLLMRCYSLTTVYNASTPMAAKLSGVFSTAYQPQETSLYASTANTAFSTVGFVLSSLSDLFKTVRDVLMSQADVIHEGVSPAQMEILQKLYTMSEDRVTLIQRDMMSLSTLGLLDYFKSGSSLITRDGAEVSVDLTLSDQDLYQRNTTTFMSIEAASEDAVTVTATDLLVVRPPDYTAQMPDTIRVVQNRLPAIVKQGTIAGVIPMPYDIDIVGQELRSIVGIHRTELLQQLGLMGYFRSRGQVLLSHSMDHLMASLDFSLFGSFADQARPLLEPFINQSVLMLDPSTLYLIIRHPSLLNDTDIVVTDFSETRMIPQLFAFPKLVLLMSEARVYTSSYKDDLVVGGYDFYKEIRDYMAIEGPKKGSSTNKTKASTKKADDTNSKTGEEDDEL